MQVQKKWIYVLLQEGFACMCTSMGSKWASYQGTHSMLNFNSPRLPDLGHMYIPHHPFAPFLADGISLILLVSFLFLCATCPRKSSLCCLFFTIHSRLLFLRLVLILATILPSPVLECRSPTAFEKCLPCQDIHDLIPTFSTFYCNDLMFSGHTMTNTLVVGFWALSPQTSLSSSRMMGVLLAMGGMALLSARWHYSIDILVAMYCTGTVLALYRTEIEAVWKQKLQ